MKGSADSASQRESSISSDSTKSDLSGNSSVAGNQLASTMSMQFLLPSSYQPSKTAPFEQLFLDHFINAFDNRNFQGVPVGSWYDHLPAIYNTSPGSPYQSCQDSTRAAMMIHYGVMTSSPSIQTEAYRWYAKALESQRTFLRRSRTGHSKIVPTAEEMLTPIILTLFELVSSTTPTGWMDHIMGAAAMLEMRGPENCQTGLAHLVFRTIRPTIVSTHSTVIMARRFNSGHLALYDYGH
jgi:hypothetical protein